MIVTSFKARAMAVTVLQHSDNAEKRTPGWNRLQQHIAKHEKAGGLTHIRFRRPEEPLIVDGYWCVELADVELFSPTPFI